MKDEIKEILEKIKCPQFGSVKYGEWGSLPLKVRIALKKLCEYANACDDYITTLQEENDQLKKRNKEIYDGFISATQELSEYAEENERLKRENNLLKADIEASQEIICDYKEEYENENERLNFNYKEALDEIDRLNNIIKEIRKLADKYEMGKYDYNVPSFEIKEILDKENKQ